jgi:hypothetical protein
MSSRVVHRFAPEHVPLPIAEHDAILEVDVAKGADPKTKRLFVSRDPKRLGGRDGYPLVCQCDWP